MTKNISKLRNIAIIAHVDHGKTTLVDALLKQSNTLGEREQLAERAMDSNDLEKERGITILAKNTAIAWNDYHINIVDTPGHADFGGEVERVLSMVDSVILLVDAQEGPMPQTRFVTQKAFDMGLSPIVVINKIDKPGARPDWVTDQVFDLFDKLGATDEQLDFPVLYASGINGYASENEDARDGDMNPLFQAIVDIVPPPDVDLDGSFQLQVSQLDYDSYKGVIGIGRIKRGKIKRNSQVVIARGNNETTHKGRILEILGFMGLNRVDVEEAGAGDIICFSGIEDLKISDTLCDPDNIEALTPLSVDEPTITMTFEVNTSPFAGKEGKFLTSRQIRDRLDKELLTNVALRVEDTDDPDKFRVSGRGELHLGVLIENMRREGFELGISPPEVIIHTLPNGDKEEPYEQVVIDVEEEHQGTIMEKMGLRRAEMKNLEADQGRVRMEFIIPSRGLIGFRNEFITATKGTGLMFSVFDHFGEYKPGEVGERINGVMISNDTGKALAFAIFNLQDRGQMFIEHAQEVYEGQVIGIHSRDNDLTVNPLKGKKLTNMRASGSDEAVTLVPPIKYTLEQAIEFIENGELVEVTPANIRIRKRYLKESDRKKNSRKKEY